MLYRSVGIYPILRMGTLGEVGVIVGLFLGMLVAVMAIMIYTGWSENRYALFLAVIIMIFGFWFLLPIAHKKAGQGEYKFPSE